MGKTKISLLTQSVFLAFAICTAAPGFAQQASAAPTAAAPAQTQAAKTDTSEKAVEKNGVYEVGGPVLPTKVIHSVEPSYTQQAARFQISGDSTISLIVDANGNPRDAVVIHKIGLGLDENAIKAVKKYRFEPATLNGEPVPVRIQVVVQFRYCETKIDCEEQLTADMTHPNSVYAGGTTNSSTEAKTELSNAAEKDGVGTVGGLVLAPKLIKEHDPKYTKEAKKAKLKGVCLLSTVVDVQGEPQDVKVVKGLGMGLDENAIEAVKTWRFKPATLNGKPVPVRLNIAVEFHLF